MLRGLNPRRVPMNLALLFMVYRLLRAEYFIMKIGYYLVEWVGAKQLGRVATRRV